MQAELGKRAASELTVVPADQLLLDGIGRLARSYPHPHSIFGGPDADQYVQKLARQAQHPGEGWYALNPDGEDVVAAAHLSIYGIGRDNGHTLWKIRHPLVADYWPPTYLQALFEGVIAVAKWLRPGTAKFVVFLSEYETEAMLQAGAAGFEREGSFHDYYRLGEVCFVYGRTVA
jgi:hypothetical protein